MNISRVPLPLRPLLLILCIAWATLPYPAHAARPGATVAGLRLLQAQLPAGASLRRLDCEALVKTAHAATRAHREQAVPILAAALSLDEWNAKRKEETRLSCVCVVRLFRACADAAPERAVLLLETTEALYPDCAEGLTAALHDLESRVRVASNTTTQPGGPESPGGNDGVGGTAPGDQGLGDGTGFGTGAGFPGAPGFGGSSPSSGFALPTPIPSQVTPVVNN